MATKAKSAPAKSNVAKKSSLVSSKNFNAKLVAIFVGVLVVALGFLYVFLSRASAQKEYIYYPPAEYSNDLLVSDPVTGSVAKMITLPKYKAQTSCPPSTDGTPRTTGYRYVVNLKSLNLAFAIPQGCHSSALTDEVTVVSINTQSHTLTTNNYTFNLKGSQLHAYVNEQKKLLYLFAPNDSSKMLVIDGATSKLLREISVAQPSAYASGFVVSNDGTKLYALYGQNSNSSYPTYNNIVAYDAVTGVQLSAGKFNASGLQYQTYAESFSLVTKDPSSSILYGVGSVVQTNGNSQTSQLVAIDTTNYANSKAYDLPGGYTSITDIEFAQGKVYMVAHKVQYDWSAPKLLMWNPATKAFATTVPGSTLPANSTMLQISQDPTRMYLTSYGTVRQYIFDTGELLNSGVTYGAVVLGEPISTTTPVATPTTTVKPPQTVAPTASIVPPTASPSTSTDPVPNPASKTKQ